MQLTWAWKHYFLTWHLAYVRPTESSKFLCIHILKILEFFLERRLQKPFNTNPSDKKPPKPLPERYQTRMFLVTKLMNIISWSNLGGMFSLIFSLFAPLSFRLFKSSNFDIGLTKMLYNFISTYSKLNQSPIALPFVSLAGEVPRRETNRRFSSSLSWHQRWRHR